MILQGLKLLQKAKQRNTEIVVHRPKRSRPGQLRRSSLKDLMDDDDEEGDTDDMSDMEQRIRCVKLTKIALI